MRVAMTMLLATALAGATAVEARSAKPPRRSAPRERMAKPVPRTTPSPAARELERRRAAELFTARARVALAEEAERSRLPDAVLDPSGDFARLMITQDQAALDVAMAALAASEDGEARRRAAQIVADRQRELRSLKRWLARLQSETGVAAR